MTREWYSSRVVELARELNVEEAMEMNIRLNKFVEEGLIEMLLRLRISQVVKILIAKFAKDSNFRGTIVNVVKLLSRKRTAQQIIQRIKRKTY